MSNFKLVPPYVPVFRNMDERGIRVVLQCEFLIAFVGYVIECVIKKSMGPSLLIWKGLSVSQIWSCLPTLIEMWKGKRWDQSSNDWRLLRTAESCHVDWELIVLNVSIKRWRWKRACGEETEQVDGQNMVERGLWVIIHSEFLSAFTVSIIDCVIRNNLSLDRL